MANSSVRLIILNFIIKWYALAGLNTDTGGLCCAACIVEGRRVVQQSQPGPGGKHGSVSICDGMKEGLVISLFSVHCVAVESPL